MALIKVNEITDHQMDTNGVVAAPTVLTGTPAENKAIFDRMIRKLIAPIMNIIIKNQNEIVDNEVVRQEAESGRDVAEQLRVEAEEGRVEAEEGRVAAEIAREQAEAERRAVSEDVVERAEAQVTRAQGIVDQGLADIHKELELAAEEGDRAAERAEAAWTAMNQAEDACGWAEDAQAAAEAAQAAAEAARDEALALATQTSQSETAVTGAVSGSAANAELAAAAAGQAQTILMAAQGVQSAIHFRRYIRAGTASDAELLLPGDELVISDDSSLEHVTDFQDLIWAAQAAAAGQENDLADLAVLSVVNATNWRRDAEGALWTTDTLEDFCARLTAFAAAAVAAGYVTAEGACVATWAQAQAWFIAEELLTPLDAEAKDYTWRKAAPKTEFDALKERMASIEAQLGQAADLMNTLIEGGDQE